MAKRGNGEGSICKRRNKEGKVIGWKVQYYVETVDGRVRQTRYTKTRAEAVAILEKAQSDRNAGLIFDAGKVTVGEYMDGWLADSVKGTVKETTYSICSWAHRIHIRPGLGDIRLKDLTPAHVRGFYAEKSRSGLLPATVRKIHSVLRKALGQAVSDGLLLRNVAVGVRTPRIASPGEEINALDQEGVAAFLGAARGERLEALYVVAVNCGLRRGELLALKWEDVDLDGEKPALTVRRTLTRGEDGRGWVIGNATKSEKGRRVRLNRIAASALSEHRRLQLEERVRFAGEWQDLDLVFPTGNGCLFNPSNLRSRSFRRVKELSGVRSDLRFHDLRHTCATILLGQKVHVKVVSEMLGHASVQITLNTYSHVLPDMQDAAADAMDAALGAI